MTKIIWMSDPHFQHSGTIKGLDPRKRLAKAIEHANHHYPDADFAILSGDLIGDDVVADYTNLKFFLEKSRLPIYPMMGNNDNRPGFLQHMTLPQDAQPGFAQFALGTAVGQVLCLDSHKEGAHTGELCQARRDWVFDQLSQAPETPAYIFMHHPPMELGLPKQDELRLEDGLTFLQELSHHQNVKHLFMGHVHRTTCGSTHGIPFTSLSALSFQAPPPRPDWDWSSFAPAEEAPQYAVIDITDTQVTLHFIQFCDHRYGMA